MFLLFVFLIFDFVVVFSPRNDAATISLTTTIWCIRLIEALPGYGVIKQLPSFNFMEVGGHCARGQNV